MEVLWQALACGKRWWPFASVTRALPRGALSRKHARWREKKKKHDTQRLRRLATLPLDDHCMTIT